MLNLEKTASNNLLRNRHTKIELFIQFFVCLDVEQLLTEGQMKIESAHHKQHYFSSHYTERRLSSESCRRRTGAHQTIANKSKRPPAKSFFLFIHICL
jgi:hypothetical protein